MEKLHYAVDPISTFAEVMKLDDGGSVNDDGGGVSEDFQKDIINSLSKGVIWGVMGRLKEIILQKRSRYIDEDASKTEFINTLEEIKRKFIKLFSLNACRDFFEKMHHYKITELSNNINKFLEEYKRN
jgi:hypothetical protein